MSRGALVIFIFQLAKNIHLKGNMAVCNVWHLFPGSASSYTLALPQSRANKINKSGFSNYHLARRAFPIAYTELYNCMLNILPIFLLYNYNFLLTAINENLRSVPARSILVRKSLNAIVPK